MGSYVAHDETQGFDPSKVQGNGYNTNTWGADTATLASASPILSQKNDLWGNIGAGGYSAANSALFGLPDFLIKKVGGEQSDAYKYLRRLRDEHKQASQIGDVAGAVGSMFIPGGLLLKGAGAGLKALSIGEKLGGLATAGKALTKAGSFAGKAGGRLLNQPGMATFGNLAQRGALQGIEQALPRGIVSTLDTGDVGGAARDTLLGTALGAGGSALLGHMLPAAGAGIKKFLQGEAPDVIKGALRNQILAEAGVNTRALVKSATFNNSLQNMGVDNAEKYADDIASKIVEKNLWTKQDLVGALEETAEPFKVAAKVAKDNKVTFKAKTPNDPTSVQKYLKGNPEYKQLLARDPKKVAQFTNELLTKSDKSKGFIDARKYLHDEMNTAFKGTTRDDALYGKVADQVLDGYEEVIKRIDPTTEWAKMKNDYRLLMPLKLAATRGELTIGKAVPIGSDTAWKLAGGTALIGGTGNALSGDSEQSMADRLAKFGVGTIAGGTGGRLLAGLANRGLGRAAGAVFNKARPNLEPGVAYDKMAAIGKGITDKIPEGLKDATGAIAKASPEMSAKIGGAMPSTLSGQNELPLDDVQQTPGLQSAQTQQAQQLAQTAPAVYQDRIMQGLMRDYQGHWSQQVNPDTGSAYSFEDVVGMAAQATNGFQPELSARILFQNAGEQGQYQQDFSRAKQLGKINVLDVFAQQSALGRGPKKDKAINDLVNFIGQLTQKPDDPKIMSKENRKLIESDLMKIDKLKISAPAKKALVEQTLEEQYGLNLSGLKQLGVI
jgi:hypothetical protein